MQAFARPAKLLTALTTKNTKFVWSDEPKAALEELKEKIITAPLLRYPADFSQPFIVATDASAFSGDAVLSRVF